MSLWDGCAEQRPADELAGSTAFFELDLSSCIELTVLVAIIPMGKRLVLRN